MQGYNQVPGEGLSAGLSDSASRLFSADNLRSIGAMLGTGEDKAFSLLLSPTGLLDRLRHNLSFFYLNYMALTGLLFFLNVFLNSKAWLGMIVLACMWVFMINRIQDEQHLKVASKCGAMKQMKMKNERFLNFLIVFCVSRRNEFV